MTEDAKPCWERLTFEPEVLGIVKAALATKLWRGTWPEQVAKLAELNRNMSARYGAPVCDLRLEPGLSTPLYLPDGGFIVLNRPSLVSWAHEFAHHLAAHGRGPTGEEFPKEFSLGLFYRCAPALFEAARRAGRLAYAGRGE